MAIPQQGHTQRHTPFQLELYTEPIWSQLLSQQLFHIISFLLGKISLVKDVERDDILWIWEVWVLPSDLAEEQVELLARAVVSSLGKEELDLLLNLLFIQMPAVLIIDAGSRCGVRGPYSHTLTER